MPGVTSRSNSASPANFPLRHQNVGPIRELLAQTRLNFDSRLVRHQDLPPKRLLCWRNLRQHFKEGLAIIFWDLSYTRDGQVSVDLSKS